MVTLDYVIYDTIANACFLAFAILVFKRVRFAWFLVLASLAIKVYVNGKYGMTISFIYLSAHILSTLIATVVWLKAPIYTKPTKKKRVLSVLVSLIVLACWILVMYQYVNPWIFDYQILFGFDYLCYMLFTIGIVFCIFRLAIGLLFIAVETISYAVNYANSAMIMANAPQYMKTFVPYYWISAIVLFIAGITLVVSYTNVKRNI